jgi:protein-disulfide isomerase
MSPKQNPGKDNFTRNLVIAVVLGVTLIMLVPTLISKQTNTSAQIPSSVSAERGYGIVFNGELKGVPVIDIYEDFLCGYCADFEAAQGQYIEELITDKRATVVYHPLSFVSPTESRAAANAGACAADEGKFLNYHKVLYANTLRANLEDWTNAALVSAGQSAGISSQKFTNCVTNGKYSDWVSNVSADGANNDVNQTPTVFINGKELARGKVYLDRGLFKAAVEKG